MRVKIIGRWEQDRPKECPACVELRKLTRLSLDELGLSDVKIEDCESEQEYNAYGVIVVPLLIINGRIKTAGKVVPKQMLKELLKFELEKEGNNG